VDSHGCERERKRSLECLRKAARLVTPTAAQ
jgi:hypothetical protein